MARIHAVRLFVLSLTTASFVACGTTKATQPTGFAEANPIAAAAGNVSGQAEDGGGTALAGVALTLTNGAAEFVAVSDDAGNFVFSGVPGGAWTLSGTKDGYALAQQPIQVNGDTKVFLQMGASPARPLPLAIRR